MIDEVELLRLIDEQRAAIIAETGQGDDYRTGCIVTLQWVRELIERAKVMAGKHVTRETYTRAQIAALAAVVEAMGRSPWVTAGNEVQAALTAMRRVIPKERDGG